MSQEVAASKNHRWAGRGGLVGKLFLAQGLGDSNRLYTHRYDLHGNAVLKKSSTLRRPLCLADHTVVLILEILRIRLDVENVTRCRIGLCRTRLVRAGNGLQMGQGRVQFRVVIDLTDVGTL